jgi:hypothetical protein
MRLEILTSRLREDSYEIGEMREMMITCIEMRLEILTSRLNEDSYEIDEMPEMYDHLYWGET